jgi:hypothetical protein
MSTKEVNNIQTHVHVFDGKRQYVNIQSLSVDM